MAVRLRSMTPEEFVPYEEADARRYAENMVRAGFWSSMGSYAKAKQMHARLLPDGIRTQDHLFFVVEDTSTMRSVGVVWLFIDRQTNPPSGFIYDFLVYEPYRGQGLGRGAMLAMEEKAKDLGLSSLALNVFAGNEVAKALYISLGYQVQSMAFRKPLAADEEDVA